MLKICLNCDDFGLSSQICKGIRELIELKFVGSVSVMVNHLNKEDAQYLRSVRSFVNIGLHFDLTTLRSGSFNKVKSPFSLARSLFLNQIKTDLLEDCLNDQIELFKKKIGANIDFIDCHQNIHIFKSIRSLLKAAVIREKMFFWRNPSELCFNPNLKSRVYGLIFKHEVQALPFWGTSFMGNEFNSNKILRQFDFLEKNKIDRSIWMVHPGYITPNYCFDHYNDQRLHELMCLKNIIPSLKNRVEFVNLQQLINTK